MATLEVRLKTRAQDSAAVVAARMAKSAEEMSHWSEYDYVVVNRDLAISPAEVAGIVTAERLRRTRQIGLAEFVNHLSGGSQTVVPAKAGTHSSAYSEPEAQIRPSTP